MTASPITIINTNARSLSPKIDSLIDCLNEMDCSLGVITEMWLSDGDSLQRDLEDLATGAGVGLICRNRDPNAAGVAHGGVAVAYRTDSCSMKEIKIHDNPEKYEILVTLANLPGYSRKLVTVACYIPPGYPVARGRGALAHVEITLIEIKRLFRDPFIVVAGDFNQWEIQDVIAEFPDLRETDVGPTRRDRQLDRIFTNFGRSVIGAGTVNPLEVEPGHSGAASDHRIAYVRANLPRLRAFEWTTHQYRYFNEESVNKFGRWLADFDWAPLVQMKGSNQKADFYEETVTTEEFFPLVWVRCKMSDCPWINDRIRRLIARRKGIHLRESRSRKWRRLKKVIDELILKRKERYLLVEDARRNFFRNIKAFKSKDRPCPFDVRSLFPGKSDQEVAEELAIFFNRISCEFLAQRLINLEIPVLVRSLKSSNVELG